MNISDFERLLAHRSPSIMEVKRDFSVLIPLVEKDGQLFVLFELRAAHIRQPGEACFPGGMRETGETHRECAIRETMEELGIKREDIRVLGQFDCLHNYTNVTMYTFIGVLTEEGANTAMNGGASPDEVQEVFLIPLDFLQETEPYVYRFDVVADIRDDFPYDKIDSPNRYDWRKGTATVPIYQYENHVVWGMTARILRNLLRELRSQATEEDHGAGWKE